jgi:RNA polymerase sigma factor (sigma-70 family)
MSEQGPPPLTGRTQGGDGTEKDREPTVNGEPESWKQQVTDEISRQFPGIDHHSVLKQAAKITGDPAGAEEVREHFYAGLLRLSAAQRSNIRSLDAYIFASVRNLALRWRRRHRPQNHLRLDAVLNERRIEDFTALVADEDEINFLLNQLPEDCQEGFAYYFAEDCTAEEVAARLGISTAAFKKRLQRAMLKLAIARVAYAKRLK